MNQEIADMLPLNNKLLIVALEYREQGLSVIPVQAAGKVPLLPWTEYQKRIASRDEIIAWFHKWPDANIGIVTGIISGVTVVDLDGLEGISNAAKLKLYSPITSLTGRGKHLWYRHMAGIKNTAGFYPGIDVRGEGGFVVAPCSLSANKKRYCWAGSPISRGLLPPLPTRFIEPQNVMLTRNGTTQEAPTGATISSLRKPDNWIAEAIKEMQNGRVHNTLIRVLGKFRQHNFSEEDTYALLCPHALENGKPYEGLRAKITEIWERYAAPAMVGAGSKSETIDEFLQDMQRPEWICEPFVARKSIGFVAGLPETLKTWLCIDLAVECARESGSWAGLFPVTGCKVLFVDQERWKGETQRRFSAVLAAKGLAKKDLEGKLFIKSGTTIRLNLDASHQAFRNELLEMRPDLVIVDSFVAFHTVPENDKAEVQKVLERVKQLRTEVGCSFLFIHHENKMAYPNGEPQGEPNMSTLSGSTGIPAAAEMCLIVRKVEEHTSMVWHVKSTLARKAKPFYASVLDTSAGISVKGLDQ